jgi:hypothetical protein
VNSGQRGASSSATAQISPCGDRLLAMARIRLPASRRNRKLASYRGAAALRAVQREDAAERLDTVPYPVSPEPRSGSAPPIPSSRTHSRSVPPGNRLEKLTGDRAGAVQHPDQPAVADLLFPGRMLDRRTWRSLTTTRRDRW